MTEQDEKQIERIRREYCKNSVVDADVQFLLRILDGLTKDIATSDNEWRERCAAWALRSKSLELECNVVAGFARETIRLVPLRKAKRKVYQWCATCIENAIANVNEKCPEPCEAST